MLGDVTVSVEGLFAIPVWTADLSQFAPDATRMLEDIDRLIRESPSGDSAPFEQCAPVLHALDEGPWPVFYSVLRQVADGIFRNAFKEESGFRCGAITSWGLRINGPQDFPAGQDVMHLLHTHRRAALSSVFCVNVPEELVGRADGGTLFRDPRGNDTGDFAGFPYAYVTPRPFQLLVFPAFLEHCPACPETSEPFSSPRVVVATDIEIL